MTAVRSNFRGARACLILPEDGNRETLSRTLTRLGLSVVVHDPAAAMPGDTSAETLWDIVFVDADADFEIPVQNIPHVALIGIEAPSRLARVVRSRAAAVLPKPVRVAGVFSALFLAFNEYAIRQREAQERHQLQRRAEGRRALVQAIIQLMHSHALSEDEAYRHLRVEAMRRRVAIETWAAEFVALHLPPIVSAKPLSEGNQN